MAQANVDVQDVETGIRVCDASVQELNDAANWLMNALEQVGNGWTDEKYRQLSERVTECCEALRSPVRRIEACREQLALLRRQIQAYDETSV